MKKTILLLFILGLCIAAFFTMSNRGNAKMDALMKERNFKVDDLSDISKIEIWPKGHPKTTLIRKGKKYYLSGEKLVRENAINNLLQVIGNVGVQFIPEPSAVPNIMRDLSNAGVWVRVFDKNENQIKAYQIGGVTPNERGTYMLMEGARQPFVVELPNLEGSIRNRYLLKDIDWLDRSILDLNPEEIAAIDIEYPKDMEESFALRVTSNGIELAKRKGPDIEGYALASNQAKVRAYVDGFETLVAEYIENENPNKKVIQSKLPFATIHVTMKNGVEQHLKLVPVNVLTDSKKNFVEIEQAKYISRYFVDTDWGDLYLVQQRLVGKLLRGYNFLISE